MERNSQVEVEQRTKLMSQIRECYGRVAYTQKTHDISAVLLEKKETRYKTIQLILSTLVAGAFLIVLLGDGEITTWVGTLVSLMLLVVTTIMREFDFDGNSKKHRNVAQTLWVIREDYISLIADMDTMSIEEIRTARDELQLRTSEIYSNAPITLSKAYKKAQEALKKNEELTFSDDEIDFMLPKHLRSNKEVV
ncbi:SLATT domain-containing protein [Lysinibacillus odysseyi]|uniref:SLATT domain-containing protein n=1 Tax=Lysinibacillus odysseyi TaxID=202611 RepID=UPI000563433A|nr:SLATT domain-containing protein [Lysinibacillus odysseyi]